MIKSNDGVTFKRISGNVGDRTPATGFQRLKALYTAAGGETSINLASLAPAISYFPGQAQISVKRSSGGALISSVDFFESTPTSITFLSTDPLIAGEIVEITREFAVTGILAVQPRPDIYTAVGTAGQTLVSATFSWPVSLNPSFALGGVEVYLHGAIQTRGVDYTELNLGLVNTNQIQFVDALIGGENIILKPTYQAIDSSAATSSFLGVQNVGIQSTFAAGTQAFVDTTSLISVPNTTIVGRAKIVDITNDLRASFGVERIPVQQIVQLQNEFGPNGEPVWSAVNDDRGLIRFVGSWGNFVSSYGVDAAASTSGNDYLEISFFGTGLNVIVVVDNTARNMTYSVDGGVSSANFYPSSGSAVLTGRNYSPNQVVNVVSGLSLGVHTVRINATGTASSVAIYGLEVLNANSTTSLNVNPGTAYISGQKYQALTAQSVAYTSAVTGTRGGRVVQYLKADGTIGQTFQAVNAASAFLASADHTNEEVSRSYYPREFGAGRTDDFSGAAAGAKAFTLDDGTTTLIASNTQVVSYGGREGASWGVSTFISFTFVGTGVDADFMIGNETGVFSVTIDGVTVGNLPYVTSATPTIRTYKLASGLPYGTHTVRIATSATGSTATTFNRFSVYQPKKPSIPTGAIELADYNVMANFSSSGVSGGLSSASLGVIRKQNTREFTYVDGTGGSANWAIDPTPNLGDSSTGFNTFSDRQNAYFEYTFFGTGFEFRQSLNADRSTGLQLSLNGTNITNTNYPSLVSSAIGATFNSSTGIASFNAGSFQAYAGLVSISGLPLGSYKLRVNNTVSGTRVLAGSLDIITPIYSAKSNVSYDQQNTLPVGSNSLSDNRKTSPIKDAGLQKKNISQAFGLASSPTTSSTSLIPMPDMSVVHLNNTGKAKITYSVVLSNTASVGSYCSTGIYVDGINYGQNKGYASNLNGYGSTVSDTVEINLSPGAHKIDIYWDTNASTWGVGPRNLLVEEI